MKLFPLVLIIALAACTPKHHPGNGGGATADTGYSSPISLDTANLMIGDYQKSISACTMDTNLNALIVNADTLRAYLKDTTIKNIKLMFAEKTSYMCIAGPGANAGYSNRGFTLVIVGVNNSGNYVLNKQGMVYDNCEPCPNACPSGTASNDLIVVPKR